MWYNRFCRVKKESEIILYHKLKCDTKEIIKLLEIVTIALFIILTIIFIKYNPVYEVKIDGETIGYIKSKQAMEETINNEILALDNLRIKACRNKANRRGKGKTNIRRK